MATITSMAVQLIAKTGMFDSKMKRSGKNTRKFALDVSGAVKGLKRFTMGLAAVAGVGAGVGGMTILIKNSMKAMDVIGKLSDELGIATESLMAFKHAASLTGTTEETLNKGLQRLVRRLGEAQAGYGEGRKGLEALGLDAEKVANKLPAEALLDVAEAIKQMETPAQRAAAAYALFGRQGQDLMNFLMLGRQGLQDVIRETEKLGGAFDRVSIKQIENANDAIARLKFALSNMVGKTAVKLAPFIESLAQKFTQMGAAAKPMGALDIVLNRAINTAEDLTDALRRMNIVLGVGSEIIYRMGERLTGLQESVTAVGALPASVGARIGKALFGSPIKQISEFGELLHDSFVGAMNKTFDDLASKKAQYKAKADQALSGVAESINALASKKGQMFNALQSLGGPPDIPKAVAYGGEIAIAKRNKFIEDHIQQQKDLENYDKKAGGYWKSLIEGMGLAAQAEADEKKALEESSLWWDSFFEGIQKQAEKTARLLEQMAGVGFRQGKLAFGAAVGGPLTTVSGGAGITTPATGQFETNNLLRQAVEQLKDINGNTENSLAALG
ncbi:MAG: hypothetical protein GY832_22015 [Chloroflexi bacterium]|nr:hypothetical protein [Chloroflexota bacterium]